jgi:hypothetical protein
MDETLVVLTSDHGVAPLVENLQAQGHDARRSTPATLEASVKTAFREQFPAAQGLIAYFTTPDFFLNEAVIREKRLNRQNVERTAITALLSTGLVAKVYTHDELRSGSSSDPLLPLFQNGFYEPRTPWPRAGTMTRVGRKTSRRLLRECSASSCPFEPDARLLDEMLFEGAARD